MTERQQDQAWVEETRAQYLYAASVAPEHRVPMTPVPAWDGKTGPSPYWRNRFQGMGEG